MMECSTAALATSLGSIARTACASQQKRLQVHPAARGMGLPLAVSKRRAPGLSAAIAAEKESPDLEGLKSTFAEPAHEQPVDVAPL